MLNATPGGDGPYIRRKEPLTLDNVPVWVNIRRNHLTAVDRQDAKHVLGFVLPGKSFEVGGFGRYLVGKTSVAATAIPCDGVWLMYVSVTTPANILPPIVKRTLSAMFSAVDGYYFHDADTTKYLRKTFDVDRNVIAHAARPTPPHEGEFERAVITAEHHTHYRPEEIWAIAKQHTTTLRAMGIVLANLRKIQGVTEATVATFLAYIMTVRPQVAYLVATSRRIWRSKNVAELTEVLKDIATPIKSMHQHEVCDLTELFELQCLVNRGVGQIDWRKERNHRTSPDVVKVSLEDVVKYATEIFLLGKAHGYHYRKMDRQKYISARWEWSPTGSIHSQYPEDERYIPGNYRQKTKFVALNMMSRQHVDSMFLRKPEIHAWTSVKYEWAKQRAIYGVDLTSTVITNFAMYRCEEVFKHRFPVGEEAAADRVHRRLKIMLEDNESFCYDFDDFNAQHSTQAMQAVLVAYLNVFQADMSDDQREAMSWVIDSLSDVTIHNSNVQPPEQYELKGTLLSGWRLTTFMNTALNYVYFKAAGCFDIGGVRDSVHNGDDVLVSIKHIGAAVKIHHRMAQINARAQPAKCNVFSVGEFLRVEHKVDKDTGLGAQYLTRACATLVHSRCESQEPEHLTGAVKAIVTRAREVFERAKISQALLADLVRSAIRRVAAVFHRPAKEAFVIAELHAVVGGASTEDFAPIDFKINERCEYDRERCASDKDDMVVTQDLYPGIFDYARTLAQAYEGVLDEQQAKRRVISATTRQISVTRKTWLDIVPLPTDTFYRYGRALYKMYHGLVSMPHLEKARFVGIPPIALLDSRSRNIIRNIIVEASDVEYALRVLL